MRTRTISGLPDDHYRVLVDHFNSIMDACTNPAVIKIKEGRRTGDDPSPSLHLLPCKIQCTCDQEENKFCRHPANVETFFEPVTRKIPAKESGAEYLGDGYSATFRGRPLRGVLVNVADAEGFTGQVLRKCEEASNMEQVRASG